MNSRAQESISVSSDRLHATEVDMRRFLSVTQAAQALGVCDASVRRAVARGELRAVRIGGRVLVAVEALDALPAAAIAPTNMDAGGGRR